MPGRGELGASPPRSFGSTRLVGPKRRASRNKHRWLHVDGSVPLLDVKLSIRVILRGHGFKVGEISRGRLETRTGTDNRTRHLAHGDCRDDGITNGVVERVHQAPPRDTQDRACRQVCQRSTSAPDVALTCRAAVADPWRFGKSGMVAAKFGLTPKNISRARPPGVTRQEGRRRHGANPAL